MRGRLPDILPAHITTPRLFLRPITPDDAIEVYQAKIESWDDFWRWGIWMYKPRDQATLADDVAWCALLHNRIQDREKLHLLAFSGADNQLVGAGSLAPEQDRPEHNCIGYWVRSTRAGQGYGTEIATALCHLGLNWAKAGKLVSFHADGNIGSQRVLEKTGFICTRVLAGQHHIQTTGQTVDEIHYVLKDEAALPQIDINWTV